MNSVRNINCMILTFFFAIDVFSSFFPKKTVRLIFEHLSLSHCVYGFCFFLCQLGNCKQILFSITYSSGQSINTCVRCKFMLSLFTQTIIVATSNEMEFIRMQITLIQHFTALSISCDSHEYFQSV